MEWQRKLMTGIRSYFPCIDWENLQGQKNTSNKMFTENTEQLQSKTEKNAESDYLTLYNKLQQGK